MKAEDYLTQIFAIERINSQMIYNDEVILDGQVITHLNSNLIKSQGLNDVDVERLKYLHQGKYNLLQQAKQHQDDKYLLRMYANMIEQIEFELQRTWKFPLDRRYHRFWEIEGCTCPKMDNNERIGTDWTIVYDDCPIHGEFDA